MKPKGLGELYTATSDLANQTGIEKITDLLIIHKLNLRSSHLSNIHMGHGNQRPEIELVRAFMPVLVTSNFDDDSIKNE